MAVTCDAIILGAGAAGLFCAAVAERWLEVEGFTQPLPPLRRLEERLHAWSVIPTGSEDFDKSGVTGGGSSTDGLGSKTMQARNLPGLFFVGEVVGVTGHSGGYNS